MNVFDQLQKLKVKEVFNDCIKRPFLYVYPDTRLLEVTTFFAIGPEIYVDGVLVIAKQNRNGEKIKTPIGRIGGKNILSSMLEKTVDIKKDFLEHVTASQIMIEMTGSDCVELESPLSQVIDIFERTRFAFVPVVSTTMEEEKENNNNNSNDKDKSKNKNKNDNRLTVIGILNIRDFLPLIVSKRVLINQGETEGIINQISSPLVSVSKGSTIRYAISVMVNKGIRNIGIENCNHDYQNSHKETEKPRDESSKILSIINDRKIMEFLLSRKRREESNIIFGSVNDLDVIQIHSTKSNITIVEAAQRLMDMKNQFLILEGNKYIVTPWDLVMKTATNRDL